MRKLLGCVVALTLLAFVCGPKLSMEAHAQKDKDKKAAPGTIEIGEGKDGKFRLTIRDSEGKFLALSAAFATEKEARQGIEDIKEAMAKAKVVVKKAEKDKKDDKKEKKDDKKEKE